MKEVKWVIIFYLLLAVFSIPHLIDDFLFDIPYDFGISNMTAQILAGVFIFLFMLIFMELVRGKKTGLYGGMFMGLFLALAGILKHIPLIIEPGPYWSGWFSEGLIIGMIISGLSLLISGFIYLKRNSDE
jgi:hypothetical protein